MKQILLFLTFVLSSKLIFAGDTLLYADKTFSYTLTVDSVLWGDDVNHDCVVKSISISQQSDKKQLQVIIPKDNHTSCEIQKDQLFIIEDVNFDGYNDIRLLQFIPASPNVPYYYWIYNTKTKLFEPDSSLEELIDPDFDYKTKTIYSAVRCGYGIMVGRVFKYLHGKLTLIEENETSTDIDTGKETIITRKLIRGRLTEISRTTD